MNTERPRDNFIYNQFSDPRIPSHMKTKVVDCRHCDARNISAQVSRMRLHLSKCDEFHSYLGQDEFTLLIIRNKFACPNISNVPSGSRYNENCEGGVVNANVQFPPKKKQKNLDAFVDKMTDEEKERLDYKYAKYVHRRGYSFNPLDNKDALDFLEDLRPAYIAKGGIPSREKISGQYLVRHHAEIMNKVDAIISKCHSVCITEDGWTDRNSNGLKNIMLCCPQPFLIGASRNTTTSEETSNQLAECKKMIERAIKIFKTTGRPSPAVIGFCTDSPNVNKSLRRTMANDEGLKSIGVVPYGCSCHALNNFGKDVCKRKKLRLLFKQAKVVVNVFRNVRLAKKHLRDFQIKEYGSAFQLVQASETRWNSQLAVLESILRSKAALMSLNQESRYGDLSPPIDLNAEYSGKKHARVNGTEISVGQILDSREFWDMLQQAISLLRPIAFAVTILKSDHMPISMVPMAFVMLFRAFKELSTKTGNFPLASIGFSPSDFVDKKSSKSKTLPDLLRRRWNEITANSVDPKHVSPVSQLFQLAMWLDDGTKNSVISCIRESIWLDKFDCFGEAILKGARYLVDLIENGETKFLFPDSTLRDCPEEIFRQIIDAVEFTAPTTEASQVSFDHPLRSSVFGTKPVDVMIKHLFRLPTSAAGGERAFSQYGNTHSHKRNKLNPETLDQLVKVRFNSMILERGENWVFHQTRKKEIMEYFFSTNLMLFTKHADIDSETEEESESESESEIDSTSDNSSDASDVSDEE